MSGWTDPKQLRVGTWTHVTQLPEADTLLLLGWAEAIDYQIGSWDGTQWINEYGVEYELWPTHWMDLPELPETDDTGDELPETDDTGDNE